jgi:hypothetical protein
MKKRVCVAHYNEDLDWLKKINNDIDIFVYHKKDNNLDYNQKVILDKNNFELRNVGRESHTYLKHIIDNYDNLCNIEYFSQGYPYEYDFVNIINNDNVSEYKQYSNYHCTFFSKNGYITEHMKNENYPDTIDIWNNLFNYPPPELTTIIPHAFIKLNKETILIHDKSVYIKCLEYFKDNEKNNLYGWSFEYFWALLFNEHHIIKQDV